MELGLQIKLASLVIHAHEFIDTGHHFDSEAFKGLLSLPDVKDFLADMEKKGFTPLRRDGLKYAQSTPSGAPHEGEK